MTDTIISRCEARGLRMTGPRRTIARVLQESDDHPDVEELHARANAQDSGISLATVYRTVKLLKNQAFLNGLSSAMGVRAMRMQTAIIMTI